MTVWHPFEYLTVRVVPRVERAEFVNVGVVVYCQALEYLDATVDVDPGRLMALDPGADANTVTEAATAYVAPCWAASADPAAATSAGERFRWMAAPRSTVVQPGPVHPGLTTDPAHELDRLMELLVRVAPVSHRQPGR
ncbi:DUF3037 domain-containing protein [Phytoactinopolyspora limicola]|uniref:DUF3037 domain-containing protein n=1 Tax=Phytoactinopolyspora limicola TaxID=2715536 RepID=UPI0014097824|nr:DUF3037 domain-containing protein [Phytoactinopolyspora limicola]